MIIVVLLTMVAFAASAIITGRDIPLNLAGLLGTILGLAIGSTRMKKIVDKVTGGSEDDSASR